MNSFTLKWFTAAAALCCLSFGFSFATSAQQAPTSANAPVSGAAASTPRTADGHPDLSGLWNGGSVVQGVPLVPNSDASDNSLSPLVLYARNEQGKEGVAALINFERDNTLLRRMEGNKPQYKPQYWDTVKNLDQNGNDEDPAGRCMPPGVPRAGIPAQIVQTRDRLVFLYTNGMASSAFYRVIPIDARKHTPLEDLDGSWNGESIGHWEGDTMVIDSIGFNTDTWWGISGYFHSENMHVVERLTRNGNLLTWQATVDDPDVLLEPWTMDPVTVRLNKDSNAVLPESPPCSERDYSHVVTKEHH